VTLIVISDFNLAVDITYVPKTRNCSEQNTQQYMQLLPTALYLARTSASRLQAAVRNTSGNSYGWQATI